MKTVCVFCGSSSGVNEIYRRYAEELGIMLAESSISLVYGGGDVGLMGVLSRAVMSRGGHVTGVIPELLHKKCPTLN